MLLLGHLGITLAAAHILDRTVLHRRRPSSQAIQQTAQHTGAQSGKTGSMPHIDIRLLFLGALLPDIIDKPLGHLILRSSLDNGRIYGHTLLFAIIISLTAFYLWKYKHKSWLLPVAFGVFMHLILDEMWLAHETLLWPFFGWSFPQEYWDSYLLDILRNLVEYPGIFIPEIIGCLVLIWYAIPVVRKRDMHTFIRTGRL